MMLVTTTNDSGAGSLRDIIAAAQPGDTIRFDASLANQTITLTSGEIFIAAGKNLVIDGVDAPNLTISGNNNSRIFRLGSNVSFPTNQIIRNLTLANGKSDDRGGAIQTEDLGNLTVENVTFRDNVAINGGASIWTNNRSGGVTVIDSSFINNRATAGNNERGSGGIAFIGFAPEGSQLVVRGSEFVGNQGINGAAINVINGRIIIENSRFINNDTTAASFDTGQPRDFLRGYGGALYVDRVNDSLEIRDSVFQGNFAEGEGGAAYLFADPQDTVTIENTIFRDNQVAALTGGGNGGNGGAIAHVRNSLNPAGKLTVSNSSFVDNLANSQGGGIWVNQTNSIDINNSTFSGNRATTSFGGAITTYQGQMDVTNVTIADNSAELSGAISRGTDASITATNTIFANNTSNNTFVSFNRNQQTNRTINDGGGNVQFPAGPEIIPGILIADPKLGAIENINGTLVRPLQSDSAAIDAGVNVRLNADQRGESRPQDGDNNASALFDSGAFEVVEIPPVLPVITVSDAEVTEGDSGTSNASFTVTKSGSTTQTVTLDFATADGTATATTDYTSTSGTLSFAVNETSKTIVVPILGDTTDEPDETFTVNISNITNATVSTNQVMGTIRDDDEEITAQPPIPPTQPPTQPTTQPTTQPPINSANQTPPGTFELSGEEIGFQLNLTAYQGSSVSEIGLFLVDDEQGSINGLLPTSPDYLAAALERSQVVFSALNSPPNNFKSGTRTVNLSKNLSKDVRARFLLVEGGSLDAVRSGNSSAAVILPDDSNFSTTQTENISNVTLNSGNSEISFTLNPINSVSTIGTSIQGNSQGKLIDLRSTTQTVQANFTLYREAAFNNVFSLYQIENEQGAVIDPLTGNVLLPGETGYITAALNNRVDAVAFEVADGATASFSAELDGGLLYAPLFVVDGTIEQATADLEDSPQVYTPFMSANSGNIDRIRLLSDNTFGFEDLPLGGDFDYNDMVVQIEFS